MRKLLLIVLIAACASRVHGKTVKKQLPGVESVVERPPLLVQAFDGIGARPAAGVDSGLDADEAAEQQLPADGESNSGTDTRTGDSNAAAVDDFDVNNCFPRMCHRMYLPVCAIIDGAPFTAASPCDFNNRVICARMARHVGKAAPTIRFLHRGPCA